MGLDLMDDSELARAAPIGIRGPLSRCLSLSRPWRYAARYVNANFSQMVAAGSSSDGRASPPVPSQAPQLGSTGAVARTVATGPPIGLGPAGARRRAGTSSPTSSEHGTDASDRHASSRERAIPSSQLSQDESSPSPAVLSRMFPRRSRSPRRACRSPRRFVSDTDGSADPVDSVSDITSSGREQSGAPDQDRRCSARRSAPTEVYDVRRAAEDITIGFSAYPRWALQNGMHPDTAIKGRPLLHLAVKHDRPELVHLLLDARADVQQADKYGRTPAMIAVGVGGRAPRLSIATILLSAKAKIHVCGPFRRSLVDCGLEAKPRFRGVVLDLLQHFVSTSAYPFSETEGGRADAAQLGAAASTADAAHDPRQDRSDVHPIKEESAESPSQEEETEGTIVLRVHKRHAAAVGALLANLD